MNTMYFYEKNKGLSWYLASIYRSPRFLATAVGGCQYREQDDPGNLQLDWLDVQLDIFRRRGIQVHLFVFFTAGGLNQIFA